MGSTCQSMPISQEQNLFSEQDIPQEQSISSKQILRIPFFNKTNKKQNTNTTIDPVNSSNQLLKIIEDEEKQRSLKPYHNQQSFILQIPQQIQPCHKSCLTTKRRESHEQEKQKKRVSFSDIDCYRFPSAPFIDYSTQSKYVYEYL